MLICAAKWAFCWDFMAGLVLLLGLSVCLQTEHNCELEMKRINKKQRCTLARPQLAMIVHCVSNGFTAEVHWVTVAGKKQA